MVGSTIFFAPSLTSLVLFVLSWHSSEVHPTKPTHPPTPTLHQRDSHPAIPSGCPQLALVPIQSCCSSWGVSPYHQHTCSNQDQIWQIAVLGTRLTRHHTCSCCGWASQTTPLEARSTHQCIQNSHSWALQTAGPGTQSCLSMLPQQS